MGFLSRIACAAVAALALLSTASAGVNTPQSGWYSGNPLLGPSTLRDIACAGTTCYAAGDFGTLLKSKDSGATWAGIVTGLTLDLPRVRLAGGLADRVVVGGGCAVRRSNDGGETFFRLPFTAGDTGCATSAGAVSFSFPTENVGYLLLGGGRVLVTADGGRTFARRTTVPDTANDIICTDDRTCLAVGSSGTIQRTQDGAVSWTRVGISTTILVAITQASPQTFYAVGNFRSVMKSTDGGLTWARTAELNTGVNLRKIACGDALHCLIATESGSQLLRTVDGGATIVSVVPSNDPTFAVGFAGSTNALAAGALGSVEQSGDAGVSWSGVGTRIAGVFGAITATSDSIAYAGGTGGVLARTANGGQTWSNVSPPTDGYVFGLAAAGPDRVYVLASDGTLQRSDNGGGSYSLLDPGPALKLAILAVDQNVLLVIGPHGIRRSPDGGETFEAVGGGAVRGATLAETDPAAGAVVVYGPRVAVISTDRGARWHRLAIPRKRTIRDLDFVNARLGYVLDTRGVLWRTSNAGKSWQALPGLGTSAGYAVEFATSKVGYVALRNFGSLKNRGLLMKTADGGRTWHPQLVSQYLITRLDTGGGTDFALAGDSYLYATQVAGDIGQPERLALTARPKALKRPGTAVVSGKLVPADGGEEIVVSQFANGRWAHKLTIAASNGTFVTRWPLRHDAIFVAQVLGDADHVGAGTPVLTVPVR